MKRTNRWLPRLVTSLVVIFGFLSFSHTVRADGGKELTNVITDVSLWDVGNGETLKPDSSGTYRLTKDVSYRFESKFDLSKYDGNLEDGDYFTFTIPAPITVNNTSFDLIDKDTNIAVGNAVVTSNGSENGGTVKITLKNLAAYLQKKGGTQVQGVKGTFYTDFTVTKVISSQTITYTSSETSKIITHTISVKERGENDYTEGIKRENFSKNGGVMKEEQWSSPTLNKSGNYIHNWYLRINTNQTSYDTITLYDNIPSDSAPMQFIPEKLEVYSGYFNSSLNLAEPQLLTEGKDYTIEYNSSYTSYKLKLLNTSTRLGANGKPAAYNVYYSTTSPANGTTVVNELSMQGGEKLVALNTETTKTVNRAERSTKITTGGTIQLDTGYRITLYKQDSETGDLLKGAEFEITSPSGSKETVTTDENGVAQSKIYSASEVAKGQFTVVETKAPEGYELDNTPIKVSVGEAGVIRRIQNTRKKVAIPVTKKWDDANNQDGTRPKEVKVQLLANGKEVDGSELTLSADNNWSGSFENLNAYDKNGKKIDYSIKEIDVSNDYTSKISGDAAKGYVITNTHTPAKTEISGTKTWNDSNDQDGKRPNSITVNLLADGKVVDKQVVTANTNWSYKFSNLAKYQNGKEIKYTITEDPVKNYTTQVDGYNITNSYTPETVDIKATKNWNDNDDQDGKRPSQITVNLLADGQKVDSKQISAANDGTWTANFTGLPKYKNGKEIKYTITEDEVANYSTQIDGYNITNSYTPETVDIKATKNWDDNDNQDGKRPSQITVNLLADGQKVDSKQISAANDGTWTADFTGLPKYKNGKEIKYTVTEETVAEYESTITDFNIVNKYIPKTIEYKVTKAWDDNNNQDGKRPDQITVQLYKSVAGSEPVAVPGKTLTLTTENKVDDNTWSASFTDLPQFEKGQEISYSVKEVDTPDGYTSNVSGQLITNSHTPETVVISGTKVWNDNNDQDGKRTTSVKIQILNGDQVVDEIETSKDKNWSFESKELPKYENGQEINYTVKEVAVAAYETTITKDSDGKYTLTNSHTPEKIDLTGQKSWNDNDDQDGMRPASITVELLANGKATGKTSTTSAAQNWTYSFTGVDRYQDGKEIAYSVKEVDTPAGYTSQVAGLNITNSHQPETIDVSGTKTWNDNNDQDKIRPTTITVHLLADGKDTGLTATASATTDWKYSFKDVAKYNNGKKVTYTVVEDEVAGYTATVDGMNVTNTHTPTTKEETPPPSPNNPDKPTTPNTPGSSNNTPPKSDTPVPPTTTSVLKENNVPTKSSSKTTSNSNSLPATNGIDEPFYLIIGLILELLGLSGAVYLVRRKKN